MDGPLRRVLCSLFTCCFVIASSAWAQDGLRSAVLPERPLFPDKVDSNDLFRAGPDTYRPRDRRLRRPPHSRFPGSFGKDGFPFFGVPFWGGPIFVEPFTMPEMGELVLYVSPANAAVYVDGVYATTGDELRRSGGVLPLSPGTHSIDVRAEGYQRSTRTVEIEPGVPVTLKAHLVPLAGTPAPSAAPAARTPKPFYVVPGCYAGDKDPRKTTVGARCDASKLRIIPGAS